MTTLISDNNTVEIDKELLSNVIEDVLGDYIELKEDENTRNSINNDASMKNLTKNLKNTLGRL